MKKDKEVYMNYVCPYCLYTLDKCVCELFPPYHLIHIDKNIQEHIRILNNKGYRTMYCCEGHGVVSNTYISFATDYFKNNNMDMPNDFKYDKKRAMLTYSYKSKLTEKEVEELKKEKLSSLLEWCKNLPSQNMEN